MCRSRPVWKRKKNPRWKYRIIRNKCIDYLHSVLIVNKLPRRKFYLHLNRALKTNKSFTRRKTGKIVKFLLRIINGVAKPDLEVEHVE